MLKTIDVTALGEVLIDFTQYGVSDQGNKTFEANPGGAPANVLAMLRKLDKKVAFLGKVGNDQFGHMLKKTLEDAGIDVTGLKMDKKIPTTLALVHTLPGGDRDFSFYRKPGADIMLSVEDLEEDLIKKARIFHFGTLSLTSEPVRSATLRALEVAEEAGCLISFDPNLRAPLWDSLEDAKKAIEFGLFHANIVKIADNEIDFLLGTQDFDKAAAILHEQYPNILVLNITEGPNGSNSYTNGFHVYEPACTLGGTIETTGAGDTFCACVLNYVLDHGTKELGEKDLHDMLHYANTAAYLVTTKKGAIRSMPTPEEVAAIL